MAIVCIGCWQSLGVASYWTLPSWPGVGSARPGHDQERSTGPEGPDLDQGRTKFNDVWGALTSKGQQFKTSKFSDCAHLLNIGAALGGWRETCGKSIILGAPTKESTSLVWLKSSQLKQHAIWRHFVTNKALNSSSMPFGFI